MPSLESYAVELEVPLDKLRSLHFNECHSLPEKIQLNVGGFRLAFEVRFYPRGIKSSNGGEVRHSRIALRPLGLGFATPEEECGDVFVSLTVQWRAEGTNSPWFRKMYAKCELLRYSAAGLAETESDFVSILSSSHKTLQLRIIFRLEPTIITPLTWLERSLTKALGGFPPECPRLKAMLGFAQREGDVEVRCQDGSLTSSKHILASLSEYFQRLFAFNKESNKKSNDEDKRKDSNNNGEDCECFVDFGVYPKRVVALVLAHLITGRFDAKVVQALSLAEMKSLLDLKNQVGAEGAGTFDVAVESELAQRQSREDAELEAAPLMLNLADKYGLEVLKNLYLSHLLSLGPAAVLLDNEDFSRLPKRLQVEVGEAFSTKTFQRQFSSAHLPDAQNAGYASD